VTWHWADDAGGIGLDSAQCTQASTSSAEGAAVVVSATCRDLHGNVGSASVTLKVDKTPPGPETSVGDRVIPNPVLQGQPALAYPAPWSDGLSGLASEECSNVVTTVPGSFSVACVAFDVAGNSRTRILPYQVTAAAGEYLYWHDGDVSSTMKRSNVDGTGRTTFSVISARDIAASGSYLLYTQPLEIQGSQCSFGSFFANEVIRTDLDGGSPYCFTGSGGQSFPNVATTTSYVYVRNAGALVRYFPDGQYVGGGWPCCLAPALLAPDDHYVYTVLYPDFNRIVKADPNGGGQTVIATLSDTVWDMARSGDWIYWIDNTDGHIGRVKTDGTGLTEDLIAVNAYGFATASRYIYWANYGETTIGRANLDGTGVEKDFMTGVGTDVRHMAVGGAPLYDGTGPAISISTPAEGATYLRNQTVLANYTCTDGAGGSGVASCVGSVASGAAIETSTLGTKTFTVTATDNAGNHTTATRTYIVGYAFGGFQQPIDAAPTLNSGPAGKTYPVKFQLTDLGVPVSDLAVVSSLTYKATNCTAFSTSAVDAIETTTTGATSLRYDAMTSSFVYNWKTPSAAGCYTLWVNLSTGQQFPAYFKLK